ncbi:ankyrin repeat and SOCS box protein 10 isoform X1 [Hemitrygon akajei]|uniref:ankyrin repeat and SOCS box protein 10 isoform X1 n=1 Tax=Hemitrygon akajei TaxID=2704970 RepID=UPI003BF9D406
MSRYGFALRSLSRDREGAVWRRRWGRACLPSRSLVCADRLVHNALYTGDLHRVQCLFTRGSIGDLLIPQAEESVQPAPTLGIWSLCYKQEFTTPLQICSSRGYDQCVRHLLSCGAEPDFSPGGKTALHEACENSQAECARLLLTAGANPNAVSEDGYCPLHLCTSPESLRCAQYLLEFGGHINSRTEEKDDTALHIASRFALEEHVDLYLSYGASINRLNECGQTALHCVCGQPHSQADAERYYRVCRKLVESGASVVALDEEQQSALHLACYTSNYRIVDLLLARGVDVNRMDYGGNAPLHKALQAVSYKLDHEPERVVQSLLNYGSIRIWPGAFPKVLKYCSKSPATIEVLLNVYDHVKVTDEWVKAIPLEVLREHAEFYSLLGSVLRTPRSLQHLSRCVIRTHCRGPCASAVPVLPLPSAIKSFLLLEIQGFLM